MSGVIISCVWALALWPLRLPVCFSFSTFELLGVQLWNFSTARKSVCNSTALCWKQMDLRSRWNHGKGAAAEQIKDTVNAVISSRCIIFNRYEIQPVKKIKTRVCMFYIETTMSVSLHTCKFLTSVFTEILFFSTTLSINSRDIIVSFLICHMTMITQHRG